MSGLARVCQGRPGHRSTHRVDRVWPFFWASRFLTLPGPVQPPGRPGPGSTHRAGPSLITVIKDVGIISNFTLLLHDLCLIFSIYFNCSRVFFFFEFIEYILLLYWHNYWIICWIVIVNVEFTLELVIEYVGIISIDWVNWLIGSIGCGYC